MQTYLTLSITLPPKGDEADTILSDLVPRLLETHKMSNSKLVSLWLVACWPFVGRVMRRLNLSSFVCFAR